MVPVEETKHMQTYWDLSEKDRAALTREQVEQFEAAELMLKGVLRVEPPVAVEEPSLADVPRSTYYSIKRRGGYEPHAGVGWLTSTGAGDHLDSAVILSHDYDADGVVARAGDLEVVAVQAIDDAVLVQHKAKIKQAMATRAANRDAARAYEDAKKEQDDALRGLWDDWHACLGTKVRIQRVADTWAEYRRVAGDDQVARRFLGKVFTRAEIDEARVWGVDVPAELGSVEAPLEALPPVDAPF